MFHRTGRSATFGLVCLALAGCSKEGPSVQDETGINLRSALGNTCVNEGETILFDFQIFRDADHDGLPDLDGDGNPIYDQTIPGVTGLTDVIDVTDLDLGTDGSGAGLSGLWVGGDYFHLLPPGEYCVQATATGTTVPLLPSNPQTNCGIIVPEGGTAETVFTFQCEGQTISALDIVVLVQSGPNITGWEYVNGKFVQPCENAGMTATFTDLEGGDMIVNYEMFSAPVPGYDGPDALNPPVAASGDIPLTLAPGNVPSSTTWNPPAPTTPGTYYVYVTITDDGAPPMTTVFQALLHTSAAPTGVCYEGEFNANYNVWDTDPVPFNQGLMIKTPIGALTPVRGAQMIFENAAFDPITGHYSIYATRENLPAGVWVEGTLKLAYDGDGTPPLETATFDVDAMAPFYTYGPDGLGGYNIIGDDIQVKIFDGAGTYQGTASIRKSQMVQNAAQPGGYEITYARSNFRVQGIGGDAVLFEAASNTFDDNLHPMFAADFSAYGLYTCEDTPVDLNEECAWDNLDLQPCSEVCNPWPPAQP